MKFKFIITLVAIVVFCLSGYSQTNYSIKVETGFLRFQNNTLRVDPGPDWKGYSLNDENGIDINVINGLNFKNRFLIGLGLGYLNFEGISGLSVFSDFQYLPLKTRITPYLNMKIGYNHIWNQYENGTGSLLFDLGIGLNFKLTEIIDVYLQSGFLMTQQSFLTPSRIGLKLRF
jgi:hypothetical protein